MSCFGIDFGTTNTSAFDSFTASGYGDGAGSPLPSIVAIDKASDRVLIGRDAWEQRFELKERGDYEVIRSAKHFLDTSQTWRGHKGRAWDVVDVVAAILGELKRKVTAAAQVEMTNATFSVPVDMSPTARRTLRKAAARVGIEATTFIKESTAAIISEWQNVKRSQNIGVFDWGGGTLDVSIIHLQNAKLTELKTKGLPLAGNAIDEQIASYVHGRIMARRGQSKALSELLPSTYNDLLIRCEYAKCALSGSDVASFLLSNYDGRDEPVELTRAQLTPRLMPLLLQALNTLFSAVREAAITIETVDQIIVTGGCSKLWLFREMLENDPNLAQIVHWAREPEWAVARGAAILQKNPGAFELSESIALELCDGSYLDIFGNGDQPGKARSSLTVALVEDARTANILLHHRRRPGDMYDLLIPLTVAAMGFELEDIHLDLALTQDLTLDVTAKSGRLNGRHTARTETQELRFSYLAPQSGASK